jgi:hypothetical protein
MNGTKASLEALGVKSGNIKMELFGTGGLWNWKHGFSS